MACANSSSATGPDHAPAPEQPDDTTPFVVPTPNLPIFRVRRTVESEDASVQASRADLESSKLSLQAQVVQNYFQLRIADSQRALLDEAVQAYTRSLELTRDGQLAAEHFSEAFDRIARTAWRQPHIKHHAVRNLHPRFNRYWLCGHWFCSHPVCQHPAPQRSPADG